MSGRHRQQSPIVRTAAKVALTSAVIGGGASILMGAGNASAATDDQWNQVAQCESGGNWAINTGNGYQGGLQFSPGTWAGHGGTQFAPTADQATKEQQIMIAERVLATQGKGAWPVCGVGLGAATPRTVTDVPKQVKAAPKAKPAPAPARVSEPLNSLQTAGNATTTAEVKAQVDASIANAAQSGRPVNPAIVAFWNQAKGALNLTPGQIALFNQNKGLIPLP
ncbi:transglycosylase family protein [Williamsia sp. CHRR-6]|uniref:transglycosylase family protein n=1 Tax=Williamsia sp. CHRR-6 TaxID=2835871 RepID=UPI001BD923AB|nr:transglycosylase family protein [Williamsia sp. CHRR-6]MBT0566392.1 transglycosylase family protein [Williamsia sp. CHRR-6]